MQYEAKTKSAPLGADWQDRVEPEAQPDELVRLLPDFAEVTGFGPRLWGALMGRSERSRYRDASGDGGEVFAIGFAPKKAGLSLYIHAGSAGQATLAWFGPHRMGKACLCLRRMDAVDECALREVIGVGRSIRRKSTEGWPRLPF
jgi:hypothetical protein